MLSKETIIILKEKNIELLIQRMYTKSKTKDLLNKLNQEFILEKLNNTD